MDRAMSHEFTAETIYHFTCGKCANWWSYAHTKRKYDLKLPSTLLTMSCPHCGFESEVTMKNNAFRDRPA
jgi:hypothetical protein